MNVHTRRSEGFVWPGRQVRARIVTSPLTRFVVNFWAGPRRAIALARARPVPLRDMTDVQLARELEQAGFGAQVRAAIAERVDGAEHPTDDDAGVPRGEGQAAAG